MKMGTKVYFFTNFLIINSLILLNSPCCLLESTELKEYAKFHGEVGAGNYSYYSLSEIGDVTFVLYSTLGDADIYVAQQKAFLNFEDYDLSSATCGVDTVLVPASFSRPVHIGIYGHVHKPLSKYTLVAIINRTDTESIMDQILVDDIQDSGESQSGGKSYVSSFVWELLETLLQILLEVLL